MSACTRPRRDLIEADLAELRGETESELGRHVRTCRECRAAAEAILEGTAELARALEAATARPGDVDVEALLEGSRAPDAPDSGLEGLGVAPRRRSVRAIVRWMPLAAAAVAAGVLLLPAGEPELPPPSPPPSPPTPPTVEAPAGRNVAVIPTTDPQITVLWFF